MTAEQIAALGPALSSFVGTFVSCFRNRRTRVHLAAYCRGLLSDLPRKSVEPIALECGAAVRTLQEFLTHHRWDHARMRDQLQRRVVRRHLPAPDEKRRDPLGVIGLIDETSTPKKGDKTPGVQRQYCGAVGKVENCIVTVHLACLYKNFKTLVDSDLFLPKKTWHADRRRCRRAHIPDDVVYRPKSEIALDQYRRAVANGMRFDWLTFDEWYGAKPAFLAELERAGQHYVAEVPKNTLCWATLPKYRSMQSPFAAKRVDNVARHSRIFRREPWRTLNLKRKTLAPQQWVVRAAQVHLARHGQPLERTHWLICARSVKTAEVKYFVSNAPPRTSLETLMKVAFTRYNVEHVFRVAKSEIGFSHFEGRSYKGLMRHMILCQLVMTFIAEETERVRGEKSGDHPGAGCAGIECRVRRLAPPPIPTLVH